MEALKSLMRLAGDLAFTVLDGIDQMLLSSAGARAQVSDVAAATSPEDEYKLPMTNPATGLQMIDGMGSVDSLGHAWGTPD